MTSSSRRRCAIYTRKSSEEGLEQAFNSLDAQREACAAYIKSQAQEGWTPLPTAYDDGGFSGGSMDRPALARLLADIDTGRIDVVVVYKVDRLTRALSDFARIVERFDTKGVSFVSVTQQFNTTSSMGRLTLNVLLSFAQFEREVTGERIRDKFLASRRKGLWMGGHVPLGYDLRDRCLVPNPAEAELVRTLYRRYLELGCVRRLQAWAGEQGLSTKRRVSASGTSQGGVSFSRGALYWILTNRLYRGEATHKGKAYPGQHPAIVDPPLWDRVHHALAGHRTARAGRGARSDCLLSGLIRDAEGQRMTPVRAIRSGKVHRYYVSQAVLQNRPRSPSTLHRVPALEIERVVVQRIIHWLRDPDALLSLAACFEPGQTDRQLAAAHALAERLEAEAKGQIAPPPAHGKIDRPDIPASPTPPLIRQLVGQVVVERHRLAIALRPATLRALLTGIPEADRQPHQPIVLDLDLSLQRCGLARRLVPKGTSPAIFPSPPDPALVKAIAQAQLWLRALTSGQAASLRSLAVRSRIDERHLGRRLRLALLAPAVIQAILQGRTPPTLTLRRLLDPRLPIAWDDQARHLGVSHG